MYRRAIYRVGSEVVTATNAEGETVVEARKRSKQRTNPISMRAWARLQHDPIVVRWREGKQIR